MQKAGPPRGRPALIRLSSNRLRRRTQPDVLQVLLVPLAVQAPVLEPGAPGEFTRGIRRQLPADDPVRILALDPERTTTLAAEAGSAMAASLVLLGAYAAVTNLVGLPALMLGLRESLPAYRSQHLPLNERALRLGHEAAPDLRIPAWTTTEGSDASAHGKAAADSNFATEARR